MSAKQQVAVARRRSRAEWQAIIKRFERSGMTAVAFSRSQGISLHTLRNWRRKLRRSISGSSVGSSEFIEVTHPAVWRNLPDSAPLPLGRWTIDIIFPDGTTARMGG
jgi:transposase-like protein